MRSRLLFGVVASAMFAIGCAQSDAGITTSVKTQLAADDEVKARRIDVDTQDRIVTLTGEVRKSEEKSQALQIARKTEGVRDVSDRLTVVPETEPTPTTGGRGTPAEPGAVASDATITAEITAKLLADPDTSSLRIDVETRNGMVTLTGKVRTPAEKTEALGIARTVQGVREIADRLTVERRQ